MSFHGLFRFAASVCLVAGSLTVGGQTCSTTTTAITFTAPVNGFTVAAGTAVPLDLQVKDNCGTAVGNATVTLTPPGGNAIALTNAGSGRYTGTYTPVANAVAVILRAQATSSISTPTPFGTQVRSVTTTGRVTGSVGGTANDPLVFDGGVVSSVSFLADAALAPGSFVTIFGRGLADSTVQPSSLPLPTSAGGTSVSVAGKAMPLVYVSATQIVGLIPYDVPLTTGTSPVVVTRASTAAAPVSITFAPVMPAVPKQGTSSQGIIVNAANPTVLADASNPLRAGDVITIYASGLGAVTTDVVAGTATPDSPLSYTVAPVSVVIGGQTAQVLFAGLTPRSAGLYQINAVVPGGTRTGDAVEVTVAQYGGGIQSNAAPVVTVAVR